MDAHLFARKTHFVANMHDGYIFFLVDYISQSGNFMVRVFSHVIENTCFCVYI